MPKPPLRWLQHLAGDPAWNMAVDEALLLHAAEPVLRTYRWQPHAVSLGYFQRVADFADLPTDTILVRRLTGGGAIHHGEELTFSLALDAALLPREILASYDLLHDAVLAALPARSAPAWRLQAGHGQTARPSERWCFATPGRGDLVTAAGKLLGSAQRRIQQPRARVLHHGSLVLERPALTPFVAALADGADGGANLDANELAARVAVAIAAALGLPLVPGELRPEEAAAAAELRRQRYANPDFTAMR